MIENASEYWQQHFSQARRLSQKALAQDWGGSLVRISGLVLEARGLMAPVGAQCLIQQKGGKDVLAEVVGFSGDHALLMPAGNTNGLGSGARVKVKHPLPARLRWGTALPEDRPEDIHSALRLPLGDGLLGRVVDPSGNPLDAMGSLQSVRYQALAHEPINAMDREPVRTPLDTGIRSINSLLTVGRGQRLGLFAGSGVGKSVLLGMMARYTRADVVVVGLIGERGREVKEFVEDILGQVGRARSVVVAAPADAPPLLRLQGASYATAVAEHFRDQGLHVLLLMESLTRYAMAQREIALAVGEPPATKGYPPSCFAKLPMLVERSGNASAGKGSITAFYTVLSEGDDQQDPIADSARAILDGHVVLSRELAQSGHYPAIDVLQSASRVMHNVTSVEHQQVANQLRGHLSRYMRGRDLIQLGAYVPGADPQLDQAIELYPRINQFLQQEMYESCSMADSLEQMQRILGSEIVESESIE